MKLPHGIILTTEPAFDFPMGERFPTFHARQAFETTHSVFLVIAFSFGLIEELAGMLKRMSLKGCVDNMDLII